MRYFPDSFQPAPDALRLAVALIRSTPGFRHLSRLRLGTISSQRALITQGVNVPAMLLPVAQVTGKAIERQVLEWAIAQLLTPQLEGSLPDFVLWTDAALWSAASAIDRERIVFHELSHLEQKHDAYNVPQFTRDGRPDLRLRPHDAELFYAELVKYGPAVPAFADTALAIAESAKQLKPRKLA
jgi:Putative phage metallopeptidase